MIQGKVVNMQPIVGVIFRLPGRPDLELEFVMDTGFAGFLTLPPAAIAALGFPLIDNAYVHLADDSRLGVDVYAATVVWNGQERIVPIQAMGRRPLLGMLLLKGYHLDADFEEGQTFTLTKI